MFFHPRIEQFSSDVLTGEFLRRYVNFQESTQGLPAIFQIVHQQAAFRCVLKIHKKLKTPACMDGKAQPGTW